MDILEKVLLSQEFPLYAITALCCSYTVYCHYRLDALTRKVNSLPVLLKAIGVERETMIAAWAEQMDYVKELHEKDHKRIEQGIVGIKKWYTSPEYEKMVKETVMEIVQELAKPSVQALAKKTSLTLAKENYAGRAKD